MSDRIPSKEEWNGWLNDPCTEAFRKIAHKRREDLKEVWASGGLKDALESAHFVGACKALEMLADLEYETVVLTELGDDSDARVESGPDESSTNPA